MSSCDIFSVPLRLGFGCSGALASKWFSPRRAARLLQNAYDGGVRCFDTASFYSGGEAERRLGAVAANWRDPVFISTKTGTRYTASGAVKDFSPAAIRRDVETSLVRLGRDTLDLVYLHGPSPEGQRSGLETLAALKDEGKVRLAGICGGGRGLDRAVAAEGVDVIMGVYNILRREHAEVFKAAKAKGVGVVAIAPLAQGLFRKNFFEVRGPADVWRIARALINNRPELSQARAARDVLASFPGWTPAQAALAFVHANPAIDVAVTTSTNIGRLSESIDAAGRTPPASLLRALEALSLDAPEGAA
ncbi:MAG TPA: aldo/keto reductase [Parvularculaceae bacterium]|nr:aldo/keto reductase [Amphiplicatus sp.]MCB9956530.1 aldo/keto reductase [Caulobacterales bacterium]HPE31881.1 aldo/keto reductase [Parvularculaceae bacterium]